VYHELRVSRVIQETADARSFVLEIPTALSERFAYRAGQFLTFQVEVEGKTLSRCYSLSSAPETDAEHKVTVKRIEEGRVSNWFNDRIAVGDVLRVLPPSGLFVLRPTDAPILLLGGGSGITPVISIVKSALAATARRMRLVYANRDRDSVIFRDELDLLARRHPDRLEVIHHLDVERGFLDAGGVRQHLPGFEDAHFYVCGPGPFMDVAEGVLEALPGGRERIFIERFVSPPDPGAAPEATPVEGAVAGFVTVHLDGETHRVPYQAGESILHAARRAGLVPPFACEDGYCGSCLAAKLAGEVVMTKNDVLTEKELASGLILTCQARPVTPVCEVRYED
jgi:3-ketosteroid 9alpha-monooxygenase subunit B